MSEKEEKVILGQEDVRGSRGTVEGAWEGRFVWMLWGTRCLWVSSKWYIPGYCVYYQQEMVDRCHKAACLQLHSSYAVVFNVKFSF